ncbi:hypothetical protein RHSIM_Rhsim01G0213300 [Rhododendron simsii]|uniref:Uncharacterized protein n=1 Tax=Rhododendron simsii TaxID=118357 RepID=A0A834HDZ0_RHOSS|nr:hypothetical protein RHSIM_Rhsim01G0213300 [Rhododendron simsii]
MKKKKEVVLEKERSFTLRKKIESALDLVQFDYGDDEDGEEVFSQALVASVALGEVVVDKLKASEWEVGYNAMIDKYENPVEYGVIDPANLTRCDMQNSASVAGMVLMTQASSWRSPNSRPQWLLPREATQIS